MIAEIGHALLWLALGCAGLQAVAGLVARAGLSQLAVPAAMLHGWLWLWVVACIGWSFWMLDLSVAGVAATTASALPAGLRLAAVVVQDGGWLVAAAALLAWGGAVLAFARPMLRAVIGATGVAGVALAAAVLLGSGSFARLVPAPTEGAGFPAAPRAWLAALAPPGGTRLDATLALGESRNGVTLVAVTPVAGPDSTGVLAEVLIGRTTVLPEWRETVRPSARFPVAASGLGTGGWVSARLVPAAGGRWRVTATRLSPVWPFAALVLGAAAYGWRRWR